ncbi:lipoprotein NlpI [Alteromonas sp. a30]|uniref:lipoprotein NlpI n=1 Tax=Alteromonas sp. a30 TaxID=2730917 RepID=UPI002282846E|nr:lipoprotein NlpI [Alteromonas sp. a30]MCY7297133.1 lipoprotein NlpI [Alteromonas sp. a30]
MTRLKCAMLFVAALAASGCTSLSTKGGSTAQMNNLLIAEPEASSLRNQRWLARLNHILSQVEDIPNDQRAELLFQRGTLYDGFGLWALAQADFLAALKYKPDMAEAHNFLGIHYTQNQEFIRAYDAFDSTLEIEPTHEFAHLNRGIALYYGGRPELAVSDFEAFYREDPKDIFRALWLYIAKREMDPEQALNSLKRMRDDLDNSRWEVNIVDFYIGQISETELKNRLVLNVHNDQELTRRLCEVYFYLGRYHSFEGHHGEASNYFKFSLSTNVYEYVEHRYARLELDLMHKRTLME